MRRARWLAVAGAVAAAVAVGTSGDPEPQAAPKTCQGKVATVTFSSGRYPNIKRHTEAAIRSGQPRVLVLNRLGAAERREELLDHQPEQPVGDHLDQDEYAPALGRRSWKAHVALVPERENRSHGASLGGQLRKYPNGTCFRYRWAP